MIYIKKRDGTVVPFNKDKIIIAINKAMIDVDGTLYETETSESIADEIYQKAVSAKDSLSVEEVQDIVEDLLMQSERRDVAKAYIRYRYRKEVARNYENDFVDSIREKLDAKNIQNQNANVDEASFGGRIGEASDVVTKRLALDFIVSPKAKKNHEENRIYIHDLGSYYAGNHNCLSIPFDDLLAKGFNTRQVDIRPANSINTAMQLLAVVFQIQSLQQFGGVSATHLDWTMVPYVRKSFWKHYKDGYEYIAELDDYVTFENLCINNEKELIPIDDDRYKQFSKVYEYAMNMTQRELVQAVEGMLHNLNSLQSRSGNQLPFSSINLGTCMLLEGRMVIKAVLEGLINGTGKLHKTSIFPCTIFQVMSGVNKEPNTPNYDLFQLALKSTSLRLYPNYANVDWSGNVGYDKNDPRTYFSTINKTVA